MTFEGCFIQTFRRREGKEAEGGERRENGGGGGKREKEGGGGRGEEEREGKGEGEGGKVSDLELCDF